jgi:hypothetical protein
MGLDLQLCGRFRAALLRKQQPQIGIQLQQ